MSDEILRRPRHLPPCDYLARAGRNGPADKGPARGNRL
jgi:hypothetical protein